MVIEKMVVAQEIVRFSLQKSKGKSNSLNNGFQFCFFVTFINS